MEILIIILLIVLIGFDIYAVLEIKKRSVIKEASKIKPRLTKEDKQEQIKKSFENLMKYDETTARRRK